MRNNNFAVFILSHGRPKNVITYKNIIKAGYSGRIYIIIDNEDTSGKEYIKTFGEENVIIFDKKKYAMLVDNGDNFENYRSTTHVRNAIFDEAKRLGLKNFLMLDDDYTGFQIRFNHKFEFVSVTINKSLDKFFDVVLDYYNSVKNLKSICFSQGGDWFGGGNGAFGEKIMIKRKAMNSFFCDVDRPFRFISRLNEDVNTYLTLGNRGELFFTINQLQLNQLATQSNKGGMTEAYLEGGTYIKSFYTVMYCPSFTKVSIMGSSNKRLHHKISWKNAVPVIIDEKNKK
jgi:hypothetical protein